jgi:hypothetical protein
MLDAPSSTSCSALLCGVCRLITAVLVSFAVIAGGVGVHVARNLDQTSSAPPPPSSGPVQTPQAETGHAQNGHSKCDAVAAARYGTICG